MKAPAQSLLLWIPRVLTILFALFISVFALDVFGEGEGIWRTVAALLMHLVPSIVVLLLLALAWRREWVGAVAYTSLGVLYLWTAWGRFHWSAYALIAGPLFLIGLLFLIAWVNRAKLRVAAEHTASGNTVV